MILTSKLPDTGITIFSRMTALANAHGAINLSQGFPDFEISADLIEKVHEHMHAGRNQYAPMQGVPVLREIIAEKVYRLYQAKYDPDSEITGFCGSVLPKLPKPLKPLRKDFAASVAHKQPGR